MAESRKRAVSVGRTSVLDEADAPDAANYALRLTQALEAISAAQVEASQPELVTYTRAGRGFGPAVPTAEEAEERPAKKTAVRRTTPKKSPSRPRTRKVVDVVDEETPTVGASSVEPPKDLRPELAAQPLSMAPELASEPSSMAPEFPAQPLSMAPERPAQPLSMAPERPAQPLSMAPELAAHDAQPEPAPSSAPSVDHTPAPDAHDQADDDWLADAMDHNERIAALLNEAASSQRDASAGETAPAASVQRRGLNKFLAALDALPPIRLPIGPPIPWKLGLPALIALVVLMGVMSRSAGTSDNQGVTLLTQQTYPVQQQAPLFTQSAQTQATPAPVGVAEPAATSGFDVFDLAIKLAAVLGLAYGSLALLKKVGAGGPGAAKGSNGAAGLKVVSSLALAPNRTVHVISVPGGKTLLVGVTPNQVNLIAELGEIELAQAATDGASFLDVLSSKLSK